MARKDKDSYNEYMRAYMAARYERRRAAAVADLGGCCAKCGSVENLEFDHKRKDNKFKTIAQIWSYSEERFWAEVRKCQLLCQECHQKKSIRQRGMKRNKGVHGTLGNYDRYGCRCPKCRKVKRESVDRYRKMRRARSSSGCSRKGQAPENQSRYRGW